MGEKRISGTYVSDLEIVWDFQTIFIGFTIRRYKHRVFSHFSHLAKIRQLEMIRLSVHTT